MKRRFELVEGKSAKFWSIEIAEQDLRVNWGRIGTSGQEKSYHFETEKLAQADFQKQVAEKLKKGYQEVAVEQLSVAPCLPETSALPSVPPAGTENVSVAEKKRSAAGPSHEDHPGAAREFWPSILQNPPWAGTRQRENPLVLKLEPLPDEPRIVFSEQERERLQALSPVRYIGYRDWHMEFAGKDVCVADFIADCPENIARILLGQGKCNRDSESGVPGKSVQVVLAKYDVAAIPFFLDYLRYDSYAAVSHGESVGVMALARPMAKYLDPKEYLESKVVAWLRNHPTTAAKALLPDAFGKNATLRAHAQRALRRLASEGFLSEIEAVAREYGILGEIPELLSEEPKQMIEIAKLEFLQQRSLPPLVLLNGSGALPQEAVQSLLTILGASSLEKVHAGVESVKQALTPASRDQFALALFRAWDVTGGPNKHIWAFFALGWLGGEDCASQLAALLPQWAEQSLKARAIQGLELLQLIGTNHALRQLQRLSLKGKSRALKEKAQEKLHQVARNRQLTREQLGDQLVPDLGLDETGRLQLDYGPRRFTISLDQYLAPSVVDEHGQGLKTLPKPVPADDPSKADRAWETFQTLKAEARELASVKIKDFEMAMAVQRSWSSEEFFGFLVQHPVLIHLVRRLVWGAYRDGKLMASFRVTEDRTLADIRDESYSCPVDCKVGLVHPLDLDQISRERWAQTFLDYKLIPPFAQIERPTFDRDPYAGPGSREITAFATREVPLGSVLGLTSRGWVRDLSADSGYIFGMDKKLPENLSIEICLDPGFREGELERTPIQQVTLIRVHRWRNHYEQETFDSLTDVQFSEMIFDLMSLFEPTGCHQPIPGLTR